MGWKRTTAAPSSEYEVNELNPKTAVRALSRSTRVVGTMFEDMAEGYSSAGSKMAAWVTRLGRVFWGLVEVSVPRSLPREILRYWLMLLYLFEALLIVGGTLLVRPQIQLFGLITLLITLAVHFATSMLGDYMRTGKAWPLRLLRFLVVGLFLSLTAVGVYTLVRSDMRDALWSAARASYNGLALTSALLSIVLLLGAALLALALAGVATVFDLRGRWRRFRSGE